MSGTMANPVPVFCFPPAGGLAGLVQSWRHHFPNWIDVIAAEYPGRGTRTQQPAISDINGLADDLITMFADRMKGAFALLGLSMGGLVAYECACRLTEKGRPPIQVFLCSCRNPVHKLSQRLDKLPEQEFMTGLRRRQGIGRMVNNHGRLSRPEMEALRSDVAASERYIAPADRMLTCPISVFAGMDDASLSRRRLMLWSLRTKGRFCLEQVPGGHFFFRNDPQYIALRMTNDLRHSLNEPAYVS